MNWRTYVSITLGITGLIAASVYLGSIDPKTGAPAPISIEGQTYEFTWTDENKDETLEIYTDRQTYNDSLSSAKVIVAVANKSGIGQDVELAAYFRDETRRVRDVSVATEITREVYTPRFEQSCQLVDSATSTDEVCSEVQTGTTTTQITEIVWVPLAKVERTPQEFLKESMQLSKTSAVQKSVNSYIAPTKSSPYFLPANGVQYYKLEIEFPESKDDNFFIEAIGSEGSYGHLDPWFNPSWLYRVKVEVVPSQVGSSSAVTNYPVYNDCGGFPSTFWTLASSTGADIRVVESDEITETAFELVSFSTTSQRCELHFLADSLATTSTSTFYVYYGNAAASAYAATDTYGRNAVWANYVSVWHLGESSGTRLDSKAAANDVTGTTRGAVAGLVANSNDFEESSADSLTDTSSAGLHGSNLSFEVVFNAESFTDATPGVMGIWRDDSGLNRRGWGVTTIPTELRFYVSNNGTTVDSLAAGTLSTATTYVVTGTFASGGAMNMYVNGLSYSKSSTEASIFNAPADFRIGNLHGFGGVGPTGSLHWDGWIDEVRVTNSVLSSSYHVTKQNNFTATSTFFRIGAQESDAVSSPAVCTYLQNTATTTDASTYTFTNRSIGTSSADRYVVVAAGARKSGATTNISSITVAGIPAFIVQQQAVGTSTSNVAALAIAAVPSGTTADIVVTYGATMVRSYIATYNLTNLNSSTTFDVGASTAVPPAYSPPTYAIDTTTGGCAIATAISGANTTATWAGATEQYDATSEGFTTYAGAGTSTVAAQTDLSISATFGLTTDAVAIFASWSANSTPPTVAPSFPTIIRGGTVIQGGTIVY